jgi:hypothetical protein
MKANPANADKPELEMRRFRPNIVVRGAGTHPSSIYLLSYIHFQITHSNMILKANPLLKMSGRRFRLETLSFTR